jgi:hypothetical protein
MNFSTIAMLHLKNRRQALAARQNAAQNRSIFIKCTLLTAFCLGLVTIIGPSSGLMGAQARRRLPWFGQKPVFSEMDFKKQEGISSGWFIKK